MRITSSDANQTASASVPSTAWALIFRRAGDKRLVLAAWSAQPGGKFTITGPGLPNGGSVEINSSSVSYLVLPDLLETNSLTIRSP
jgi:hypothetical protein